MKDRIGVLQLSAVDFGGAGIAALRLHQGLNERGHQSRLVVLTKRSTDSSVREAIGRFDTFRLWRLASKALLKLVSSADYYFQMQSMSAVASADRILRAVDISPDVIVVHGISHFLSFQKIAELQNLTGAPVVWMMLDMAFLTGGCHYAWDCRKYHVRCQSCPAVRVPNSNDLSARIWSEKQKWIRSIKGVAIASSSTLASQAVSSSLFSGWDVRTVLLGVSPDLFKPLERSEARVRLGLPESGSAIFFGATQIEQRRKGAIILIDALLRLAKTWPGGTPKPFLIVAGESSDILASLQEDWQVYFLGPVSVEKLAVIYSAADLFVCPSIEDSGPMMVNESLMSGTPVVAFSIGVVPDLVTSGVTGEVAEEINGESLAAAIVKVLSWSDEKRIQARGQCRSVAIEKCSPQVQIDQFVEIVDRLDGLRSSISAKA